jgi:hypothetical protein
MANPWYCATLLAFEAGNVIRLRMMRIAWGGGDALAEMHLMMTEKIGATVEALNSLMCGGTPMSVIERYREHVAANAWRLHELTALPQTREPVVATAGRWPCA